MQPPPRTQAVLQVFFGHGRFVELPVAVKQFVRVRASPEKRNIYSCSAQSHPGVQMVGERHACLLLPCRASLASRSLQYHGAVTYSAGTFFGVLRVCHGCCKS